MLQGYHSRGRVSRAVSIVPSHSNNERTVCNLSNLLQWKPQDLYKAVGEIESNALVLLLCGICRWLRWSSNQSTWCRQDSTIDTRSLTNVQGPAEALDIRQSWPKCVSMWEGKGERRPPWLQLEHKEHTICWLQIYPSLHIPIRGNDRVYKGSNSQDEHQRAVNCTIVGNLRAHEVVPRMQWGMNWQRVIKEWKLNTDKNIWNALQNWCMNCALGKQ